MKLTCDSEADCGYISFKEIGAGEVARTINVEIASDGSAGMVNIDVDAEDRVLGIEIIGVSRVMPGGKFPTDK